MNISATVPITTSYQSLTSLLVAAGFNISGSPVLADNGFIQNLDSSDTLFVAAGYPTIPSTDEGSIAALTTLPFNPGINANEVWLKGSGTLNANIFIGFEPIVIATLAGTSTVTINDDIIAKGDGGNLVDSSIDDDGTTVTVDEDFDVTGDAVFEGTVTGAGFIKSTGLTGIGYGVGAGLAVTQGTGRTTGVTINAPSGAITLISAAGSATPASFTVTNSAVAATDTPIVVQKSGTDLYEIFVTAVGAGSFRITSFTTGGTTTETPVFNFNIIKGVAS